MPKIENWHKRMERLWAKLKRPRPKSEKSQTSDHHPEPARSCDLSTYNSLGLNNDPANRPTIKNTSVTTRVSKENGPTKPEHQREPSIAHDSPKFQITVPAKDEKTRDSSISCGSEKGAITVSSKDNDTGGQMVLSRKTADNELVQMWENTWTEVLKTVNVEKNGKQTEIDWPERLIALKNNDTHRHLPSPNQVVAQLQAPRDLDGDAESKWGRTKSYSLKVLECVTNLGGLAAKGGSEVFPPSEICFSVFCYLLETAKKYHEYFNSLDSLLDHVIPFLHRFELHARPKSYQKPMDSYLKDIMQKLLNHFVWVCCHATKLIRATVLDKMRVATKVLLFRSDGGINDQIEKIKTLVSVELQLTAVVILNSVQVNEKGIHVIVQNIEKQERIKEKAQTSQRQLATIERTLVIRQQKRYRDHEDYPSDMIQETGKWLTMHKSFCRWSELSDDGGKTQQPILALEAPSHYGKTYLCSEVIHHLRIHHGSGIQPLKEAVAYFHFDHNGKGQKETPFDALKYIIWQLCDNDLIYRKSVAAVCETERDISSTSTLWDKALEAYDKPATFFIILDGIEKATDDANELEYIVKKVAEQSQRQVRLRLLIAAPKSELDKLRKTYEKSISTIEVSAYNETNVSRFIEREMNRAEKIKGWGDNMKQSARATLSEHPGDFSALKTIISQLGKTDSYDEIDRILKESLSNNGDNSNTLKIIIEKLEKTLDEESIEDLNEILPWIVLPPMWPTLPQINAVLDLRRGMRSVMTIEQRISTKYPKSLLQIDGDQLVSIDALEYFQELQKENENPNDSHAIIPGQSSTLPAIQGEGNLHPSVVTIVKDLVRAAIGVEQYQMKGIDQLITNRLTHHVPRISYQEVEGHGRIVKSCLTSFMAKKHGESAKALHQYTVEHLAWHLDEVNSEGLKTLPTHTRNTIGGLLHKFLTQDIPLRAWLKLMIPESLDFDRDDTKETYQAALKWFEDSEILKGVPENEQDLYKQGSRSLLMDRAIKIVAQEWLQKDEWDAASACAWLVRYAPRENPELGPDFDKSEFKDVACTTLSIEQIRGAEHQAYDQLKSSPPTISYLVRLSETFSAYGHYTEAAKESFKATEDYSEDGQAWLSLARSQRQQYPLDAYNTLCDLHDGKVLIDDSPSLWREVLYELGDVSEELEKWDFAVEVTQKLMKVSSSDLELGRKFVSRASKAEKYKALFKYLQCTEDQDKGDGKSRLQGLLSRYADSSVLHYQASLAATKAGQDDERKTNLEFVRNCYELAEKDAKEDAEKNLQYDHSSLIHLRYYHGLTLQYQLNDISGAIDVWGENLDTPFDEDDEHSQEWIIMKTAKKILAAYLEKWRMATKDNNQILADSCIDNMLQVKEKSPQVGQREHDFLIARLHSVSNQEGKAIDSLKEHLKVAKMLLTDDDPGNDWLGYYTLAEALSFVDKDNALAAWSLITPTEVENESMIERTFYSYGPLYNFCDGDCGHHWTYPDRMYVCRDCIDIQFEQKCWEKLKGGELESRVCGKSHEFLEIPAWDPERLRKDQVMVKDNHMDIKLWLETLWKVYKIE